MYQLTRGTEFLKHGAKQHFFLCYFVAVLHNKIKMKNEYKISVSYTILSLLAFVPSGLTSETGEIEHHQTLEDTSLAQIVMTEADLSTNLLEAV